MARSGADVGARYPPTEFSQKYAAVLAPKGKLVSPSDIFGESGVFGEDVEEKTKQAFKVTMKKLDKINTKSDVVKDEIARERIDQVRFGFFERKPHQKSCKSLPKSFVPFQWRAGIGIYVTQRRYVFKPIT